MTNPRAPHASALGRSVRGEIIEPADPGYDEARSVWNAAIDRRPAVIVRCACPADVRSALAYAQAEGLLVAVRGGGHNVAGNAVCDGGLVIDLSTMKEILVDAAGRTARAAPGLTWREFDHETQLSGLATVGGLVSTTGIAGFTLGGGIGWLSRKHGTASDNLLSAEVVIADGHLLAADAEQNADLFWAIRGGGGNFGVVSSFRYALQPLGPVVVGGLLLYAASRAPEILRFLRDFVGAAPPELMGVAVLRMAPTSGPLPPEVQGRPVIVLGFCYAGGVELAERELAPVRALGPPLVDLLGPRPYCELQGMLDATQKPGFHNYWKAEYLGELSDAAIDVVAAHARAISSPLSDIKVIPLGGAFAGAGAADSAFQHPRAPVLVNINSRWSDPAESQRHVAWTRELWSALQPFSAGGAYVNFLGDEGPGRVRAAYSPSTWERLVEIKTRYDPANLFRLNQNIPPRTDLG